MLSFGLILLVCICSSLSSSQPSLPFLLRDHKSETSRSSFPTGNDTAGSFSQRLDHFNALDDRTFTQHYFYDLAFYDVSKPSGGCGIVYVCGESYCLGDPEGTVVMKYAQILGCAVGTLEHRYYGSSSPFSDLPVSQLRYLSSRQALEDIVAFKRHFQRDIIGRKDPSMPWIVIGGSYPGALSAWSRLKFPFDFHASLSSSGAVNAIADFYQYDQQVAETLGPVCGVNVRNSTRLIDSLLTDLKTRNATMDRFGEGSSTLTNADFMKAISDIWAGIVSFGNQKQLCGHWEPGKDLLQSAIDAIAQFGVSPLLYYNVTLAPLWTPNNNYPRMWWWQKCTEFGLFCTSDPKGQGVRSKFLTLPYYLNICKKAFGIENVLELVDETNQYYSGIDVLTSTTNIFFTDGSQDPWQRASVTGPEPHPLPPTESNKVFVVHCDNCGHMVDLLGCGELGLKCVPPTEYDEVQAEILKTFQKWIAN